MPSTPGSTVAKQSLNKKIISIQVQLETQYQMWLDRQI